MNVNPGELRKRIQIIGKTETLDESGYAAESETVIHECFAKFSRTSGTEVFKAMADFTEIKCRFLIRYTKKAIDRKMLVRYAGEDYEIIYINDYEDLHEYTEIWCKRTTREGG